MDGMWPNMGIAWPNKEQILPLAALSILLIIPTLVVGPFKSRTGATGARGTSTTHCMTKYGNCMTKYGNCMTKHGNCMTNYGDYMTKHGISWPDMDIIPSKYRNHIYTNMETTWPNMEARWPNMEVTAPEVYIRRSNMEFDKRVKVSDRTREMEIHTMGTSQWPRGFTCPNMALTRPNMDIVWPNMGTHMTTHGIQQPLSI